MKRYLAILVLLVLLPAAAMAHPGGLDANQGHRDRKNTSGLGAYHYHCNGTNAHHHIWGLCIRSDEYAQFKEVRTRIGKLLEQYALNQGNWTEEQALELKKLFLDQTLPFHFDEETLLADTVRFGRTADDDVDIRKKAASRARQMGNVPVAGSPLILHGNPQDDWYTVTYWNEEKLISGHVMAKFIEEIPFEDFAQQLYDAL